MKKENTVNTVNNEVVATETEKSKVTKIVSIEDFDKVMADHKAKAETLAKSWNNLDADTAEKSAFTDLEEAIVKETKAYNNASFCKFCFIAKRAEDPMKYVCETYYYDTIKMNIKEVGDEAVSSQYLDIQDTHSAVKLKEVAKKVPLGHSKDWMQKADCINMLLASRIAHETVSAAAAKRIIETFDISDEAKVIFKDADLLSQTKMTKYFQMLLNAMFGEGAYKATSHDIKFIEWRYDVKKGSQPGQAKTGDRNKFLALLLEVGHIRVTGKSYEVIYPIKKAK